MFIVCCCLFEMSRLLEYVKGFVITCYLPLFTINDFRLWFSDSDSKQLLFF